MKTKKRFARSSALRGRSHHVKKAPFFLHLSVSAPHRNQKNVTLVSFRRVVKIGGWAAVLPPKIGQAAPLATLPSWGSMGLHCNCSAVVRHYRIKSGGEEAIWPFLTACRMPSENDQNVDGSSEGTALRHECERALSDIPIKLQKKKQQTVPCVVQLAGASPPLPHNKRIILAHRLVWASPKTRFTLMYSRMHGITWRAITWVSMKAIYT